MGNMGHARGEHYSKNISGPSVPISELDFDYDSPPPSHASLSVSEGLLGMAEALFGEGTQQARSQAMGYACRAQKSCSEFDDMSH